MKNDEDGVVNGGRIQHSHKNCVMVGVGNSKVVCTCALYPRSPLYFHRESYYDYPLLQQMKNLCVLLSFDCFLHCILHVGCYTILLFFSFARTQANSARE